MVLTLALLLATVPQVQPEVSSAAAAFVVFQKNCAGCHGDTGFAKGYLLLDRSAMVKAGKVTPGNAAESILYKRISGAVEPIMPDGGPKLPESDIDVIRQWIDDGAPDWKPSPSEPRRFISNEDVISAIEKDLDVCRHGYEPQVLSILYSDEPLQRRRYKTRDISIGAFQTDQQSFLGQGH